MGRGIRDGWVAREVSCQTRPMHCLSCPVLAAACQAPVPDVLLALSQRLATVGIFGIEEQRETLSLPAIGPAFTA